MNEPCSNIHYRHRLSNVLCVAAFWKWRNNTGRCENTIILQHQQANESVLPKLKYHLMLWHHRRRLLLVVCCHHIYAPHSHSVIHRLYTMPKTHIAHTPSSFSSDARPFDFTSFDDKQYTSHGMLLDDLASHISLTLHTNFKRTIAVCSPPTAILYKYMHVLNGYVLISVHLLDYIESGSSSPPIV